MYLRQKVWSLGNNLQGTIFVISEEMFVASTLFGDLNKNAKWLSHENASTQSENFIYMKMPTTTGLKRLSWLIIICFVW